MAVRSVWHTVRFFLPELQLFDLWESDSSQQKRERPAIKPKPQKERVYEKHLVAPLKTREEEKAQEHEPIGGVSQRPIGTPGVRPKAPAPSSLPPSGQPVPRNKAEMLELAKSLIDQEKELFSDRTLTYMTISPDIYERLAELGWTSQTFDRAVWRWLDRELFPVMNDLYAKGQISRGDRITLTLEHSTVWVTTRRARASVPIRPSGEA